MMRAVFILCLFPLLSGNLIADSNDSPPLNAAILKFCESKEGKRVGSGECAHLANEALRVAGAEYTQIGADGKRIPDSPSSGDYVWGSQVKTYSFDAKTKKVSDSDTQTKCKPGDILQFRDVKTSTGFSFPHHTAIVRTVDSSGNPTGVYQQNVALPKGADGRIVQKSPLQPLKMTSGQLMVYRPEKATNPAPMQISLINNSKSKTVEFTFSNNKNLDTLGAANTAGGYVMIWGGKNLDTLNVGGNKYSLSTRTAYEFYTTAEGQIALREVK